MNLNILPAQNRRLHMLLADCGISMENKADLVSRFTDGRTTHSSEMLQTEANNMIAWLDNYKPANATAPTVVSEVDNKMRRKILSLCHQMGWYLRGHQNQLRFVKGKPVLDMESIENFCKQKGPFKKALNDHNTKELATLVTVFEKVYKTHMSKV